MVTVLNGLLVFGFWFADLSYRLVDPAFFANRKSPICYR